jgi:hypothetical protein
MIALAFLGGMATAFALIVLFANVVPVDECR